MQYSVMKEKYITMGQHGIKDEPPTVPRCPYKHK